MKDRAISITVNRGRYKEPSDDFSRRLQLIIKEFGSRYSFAKSSGIPASTLQSYEAGSKPGMEALLNLARVANVGLNWLMTGDGQMRPLGLQPAALLQDILVVDQYKLGAALSMEMIVGQVPFSRYFLENKLHLDEATHKTLLAVEAGSDLLAITRGDLVLIDRKQATLARDGIYLLDFPGIELRAIFRRPDDKVDVASPIHDLISGQERNRGRALADGPVKVDLGQFLGVDHHRVSSKIVGRAVWIGRAV
jgi:transcriptional regulator with XRE-family HTH domain